MVPLLRIVSTLKFVNGCCLFELTFFLNNSFERALVSTTPRVLVEKSKGDSTLVDKDPFPGGGGS